MQGKVDHTMFVKRAANGKIANLIVYVDDIILTNDDQEKSARLKKNLAQEFEIKNRGALKYFPGMEVARSEKGIMVSQHKYIMDLLKETRIIGCKPIETPVDPNEKLGEDIARELVDIGRYQRLVGKLIYLSHTRPDIAFAVSLVNPFMHSLRKGDREAAYKILRYLKGSLGKGLFFQETYSAKYRSIHQRRLGWFHHRQEID